MDSLRVFLGIRRMDSAPNARIRAVWSDEGERLIEVTSDCSGILKELVMFGLPKGGMSVCLVGRPRERWIN